MPAEIPQSRGYFWLGAGGGEDAAPDPHHDPPAAGAPAAGTRCPAPACGDFKAVAVCEGAEPLTGVGVATSIPGAEGLLCAEG